MIEEIEYYLQLEPDDAEALFNMGISYYNLQDYSSAVASFSDAIDIDKNLCEAYYYRGVCFSVLGEHEKTSFDYAMSIECGAMPAESYYNLAMLCLNQEQYIQALEYLQSARERTNDEGLIAAIDGIILEFESLDLNME